MRTSDFVIFDSRLNGLPFSSFTVIFHGWWILSERTNERNVCAKGSNSFWCLWMGALVSIVTGGREKKNFLWLFIAYISIALWWLFAFMPTFSGVRTFYYSLYIENYVLIVNKIVPIKFRACFKCCTIEYRNKRITMDDRQYREQRFYFILNKLIVFFFILFHEKHKYNEYYEFKQWWKTKSKHIYLRLIIVTMVNNYEKQAFYFSLNIAIFFINIRR